jgi:hypothetical protein
MKLFGSIYKIEPAFDLGNESRRNRVGCGNWGEKKGEFFYVSEYWFRMVALNGVWHFSFNRPKWLLWNS